MNKFLCFIKNPQILSALIWAITIIACAYFTDNKNVTTILITAAGLHYVLMAQMDLKRKSIISVKQEG